MTLAEFHRATRVDLSLTASDVTNGRLHILNHRTAPDVPVVWAARMSMSVPLLWQEVVWREAWGGYRFSDYTRVGLPLTLAILALLLLTLPIFWPA